MSATFATVFPGPRGPQGATGAAGATGAVGPAGSGILPFVFDVQLPGTSASPAWIPKGGAIAGASLQSTIFPVQVLGNIEIYAIGVELQAVGSTASSGAYVITLWKGPSGSAATTGASHSHNITSLSSHSTISAFYNANEVLSVKCNASGSVTGGGVRMFVTLWARSV